MLAVFKYVKGSSDRKEISFSVSTGDETVSVGFKLQQRKFRLDIKKKHYRWLTVQIGIAVGHVRKLWKYNLRRFFKLSREELDNFQSAF